MRTLGLTERQRHFVAQYRGDGDGSRAAKAAGYKGTPGSIAVQASRLMAHPGVKAALEEKFAKARQASAAASKKGGRKSIGSTTRRLELLMAIAEDTTIAPRDRTTAIKIAAEIAGEVGRHRFDPPAKSPSIAEADEPDPPPASTPTGKGPRLPPRLLVVSQERGGG